MAGGELVGGQRKHSGRTPNDRRQLGELVLAGRLKGKTMLSLAQELNIGEATADRYMKLALEARIVPTVDAFRKQQNESLDRTQRTIDGNRDIADMIGRKALEDPAEPNIALLDRAAAIRKDCELMQLRLDERRAKLNGLDAPVQVQATVEHIDPRDQELADLITRARQQGTTDTEESTTDGSR